MLRRSNSAFRSSSTTVANATRSDPIKAPHARAQRLDTRLWQNDRGECLPSRGMTQIPIGVIGRACPRCGSHHLVGVKITATADEMDPNIGCMRCNFFWD